MTRIASFSQQSLLIQNTLRNQERLFQAQQQVTTGKRADNFAELSPDVQSALSARRSLAATETFLKTIKSVQQVVDFYDVQMTAITSAAEDLQDAIRTAIAQEDARGLISQLSQSLSSIVSALNSRIDGVFLFGGSRTDKAPVTVQTLSDVLALASSSDAFANNSDKRQATIAEGITMQFGLTADEVAGPIMAVIKAIADFDAGAGGPLDGPLDATKRSFLESQLTALDSAIKTARDFQVSNGLNANRLKDMAAQQDEARVFLEGLVSDLEDVDMAEAISRLNQNQIALEASFRAVGTLSRVTLLNFL